MIKKIYTIVLLAISISCFGQVAKSIKADYALTNATLVTVTKGTIQNGTILLQNGKITAIGKTVSIPAGTKTIDCKGLFVYPGMIDSGTQLGLNEIGAVSVTQDHNEKGIIKAQMQALTAVNPNSVSIPVTRVSGVTTVLTAPSGGTVSGTAALIDLLGYTPNQMYAGFKGMVVRFPNSGSRGRHDKRTDEERKKEMDKKLKKLNELWEKASLHAKIIKASGKAANYHPILDAMLPVINGEMPILLEVNKKKDIEAALNWVKEKKIKAIFTGVAEGYKVAKEIAKANIPVIVGPILSLPSKASARYDAAYTNAGLLQKAGVKVAIRTNDTENVRNLPYNAGFAAAYGMGKEEALKAITINPAEIFGLADKMGSLEQGKNATLFVSDGDPFETKTHIKHLFINGYKVPLDSRHIQLYHEFLKRSPGLEK